METCSRHLLPVLAALALPLAAPAQSASPDAGAAASHCGVRTWAAQKPAVATPVPGRVSYLRLGLGRTEGAGVYYGCARLSLEYVTLVGRRWGAGGRLVGIAGAPWEGTQSQIPHQNYTAGYAEAEGFWYPFGNNQRVTLAVGAGGFAGYYRNNGYSSIGNYPDAPYLRYVLASHKSLHAGLLGSLNLEVGLGTTQRWRVGGKVLKETGLGGVTAFTSHSLTLARRF